jgi:hypothetical protein
VEVGVIGPAVEEVAPGEHLALPIRDGRATVEKKVKVMVMVMDVCIFVTRGKCQ